MAIEIRNIAQKDDKGLAVVIRSALKEFQADKPGTVYYDETTDRLSDLFRAEKSAYFVALENDVLLGGAGIFPTKGLPADTVELVKMYLSPAARGQWLGKKLILRCIETARLAGYQYIYLETMKELFRAVKTYENLGFELLQAPLGESGHHSCEIWMRLKIS